MSAPAMLEIRGVAKRFGATQALAALSLDVAAGEFVSLLGPSGCGKTTLLRIIAGFAEPDAGEVRVHGVSQAGIPPDRRNLGLVFQNYSLWPHMTVAENVAFGLECRGIRGARRRARVAECLELVRLGAFAGRLPQALSGGQQQRVALARALAYEPALLLLDEPLSALDRKLREELQAELRRIQRELGVTTVLVTHDQDEALALSDRIAVMHDGRIEQLGRPEAIYRSPASAFVARFVGQASLLEGVLEGAPAGGAVLRLAGGLGLPLGGGAGAPGGVQAGGVQAGGGAGLAGGAPGRRVLAVIRPEHVTVTPDPAGAALTGRVVERAFLGARVVLRIEVAGGLSLLAELREAGPPLAPGQTVGLRIETAGLPLLDAPPA